MAEPIETVSTASGTVDVITDPTPAHTPVPVDTATNAASAAIIAASEAAMANPGMPGRDEFLTLATTARMLCLSGAAPKAIRDNPYVAFHVAMVGRDLGISPSAAMELIDVIDGQNGPRLSLSPQLINAQIRRLGLGSIVPAVQSAERCIAVALSPGGRLDMRCKRSYPEHADGCMCAGIIGDYEWSWEDAQMADLAGAECTPGNHSIKCMNRESAKQWKCGQGYRTYPKRMHWWRASGYLADDVFPEAGLGLYTAEELGATVDDEGRAIDVASVELPDGYETKQVAGPQAEEVDDDTRWVLYYRIQSLPDDVREGLHVKWKRSEKIGGLGWRSLSAAGLRIAQALLTGSESEARTKHPGWNTEPAFQAYAAPIVTAILILFGHDYGGTSPSPQDSGESQPETVPGTDGGADPENRPSGASQPARGQAAPEPTSADIDGANPEDISNVIAEVGAMLAKDVDKRLTELKLHTEGELPQRRHRLAMALLRQKVAEIEAGDGTTSEA